MTLVGVTGAFCTGKTTVCAFFKELGARVIDADKIVQRLYRSDKRIIRLVRKNFGDGVFTKGRIDTAKLKVAAFASKRALEKLCRIVHPRVIETMKKEAKKSDKAVTVLDAPLLIEAGLSKDVDYVVVVTATMEKRIERAAGRKYTKKDIYLRKARQMALGEKIKRADFVINNNRSKRYMKKQIRGIWQTLNGR